MLHADYLFLLTDVDALYTSNPRKDPTARAIDVVTSIPNIRSQGNVYRTYWKDFVLTSFCLSSM